MNKNIYTLKDFIKEHKNAKISYFYSGAVGGGVAVSNEYLNIEVLDIEYLGKNAQGTECYSVYLND